MEEPVKKIYVLIGNFGSGKTEIALNMAFNAAKTGKTLLVDMDMVNTYFRLSDYSHIIEEQGIRLISPNYVSTNVETLSLPAEVASAFASDWDTVVFDAGGDPAGATSLGRYHEDFSALKPGQLEVLNVVNVRRPMSGTADKLLALMREMSDNSRLLVAGFVNNTNLAQETGARELEHGYEILRQASEKSGVPVLYTAGTKESLERFLSGEHEPRCVGEPMVIKRYMHRDWDSFIKNRV